MLLSGIYIEEEFVGFVNRVNPYCADMLRQETPIYGMNWWLAVFAADNLHISLIRSPLLYTRYPASLVSAFSCSVFISGTMNAIYNIYILPHHAISNFVVE